MPYQVVSDEELVAEAKLAEYPELGGVLDALRPSTLAMIVADLEFTAEEGGPLSNEQATAYEAVKWYLVGHSGMEDAIRMIDAALATC